MDAIETLRPGTRVRLTGDIDAVVAENPRDGAWLVARCNTREARAADRLSAHGFRAFDAHAGANLVVVHADDILALAPAQET